MSEEVRERLAEVAVRANSERFKQSSVVPGGLRCGGRAPWRSGKTGQWLRRKRAAGAKWGWHHGLW